MREHAQSAMKSSKIFRNRIKKFLEGKFLESLNFSHSSDTKQIFYERVSSFPLLDDEKLGEACFGIKFHTVN